MDIQEHWIDVQSFIHRYSPFGCVHRLYGWTIVSWSMANRTVGVAMAEDAASDPVAIHNLLRDRDGEWFIEINTEWRIGFWGRLSDLGWQKVLELPGHVLPTTYEFVGSLQARNTESHIAHIVRNERQVEDFAYVQDQAYRAEYDWPLGVARSFFCNSKSLISENVIGAILYDRLLPIRTAYAIRTRNIISGVGGAVHPNYRGKHLGEPVMARLVQEVINRWDAEWALHVTMPCATPIAKRLEFKEICRWDRWKYVPRTG